MAGRSVGNIEVTVDANTKRLKAQLTAAGKQAGKSAAEAIEAELDDIDAAIGEVDAGTAARRAKEELEAKLASLEAEIGSIKGKKAARIAKKEMEETLSGLRADINKIDAQEAARVTKEQIEEILRALRVGIGKIDGRKEAELLKTQIEAQLRGIDLGLDVTEAKNDLREVEAAAEAMRLAIKVVISERDLAKINAEIRALVDEQRKAEVQFEADLAAVNLQVAAFLNERREADIQFQADLTQVNLNVRRFLNERREAEIQFDADLAAINAQVRRFTAQRFEAEIDLGLETAKASVEFSRWLQSKERESINVLVDPGLIEASAKFNAWIDLQRSKGIDVTVDPDTVRATIEFEAWLARMSAKDIDVGVDVDSGGAGFSSFSKAGSQAGGNFLDAFSGRLKLIAGAVVLLAEPAAVALQGALAATVSVASSAFSALGGAAGALVPVLATVGGAVATLIVGFSGMGDALGAVSEEFTAAALAGRDFNINAAGIKEAMAGLAPEAQSFVRTFAGILPIFEQIQQQVQGELFAGLDAELARLAGQLPALGAGLTGMATSFNTFFKGLADVIAGVDLGGIFDALIPILDSVLAAFTSIASAVEPFLLAAAPAAQELADSFANGAESLADMIQAGADSGNLTKFLKEGVDSLKLWGNLLKATGDALFTLFQAGKASGDSFVSSLTNIVERFDSWMESIEGQDSLAKFFEGGQRVMSALTPVLEGLVGLFENLVTEGAVDRFEDLAKAVGKVLPVIGQLLEVVGRAQILGTFIDLLAVIGDVIQPIIPLLQQAADFIGEVLGEALVVVTPLLQKLADILGKVLSEALKVLVPLLPTIVDLFVALFDAGMPLYDLVGNQLVTAIKLIGAGFKLAEPFIKLFTRALEIATPVIEAILIPLQLLADLLEFVSDTVGTVGGGVTEVIEEQGLAAELAAARQRENVAAWTAWDGIIGTVETRMNRFAGVQDHFTSGSNRLADAFQTATDRGIELGSTVTILGDRSDELRNAFETAGNVLAVLNAEIGTAVPGSDRLVSAWAEIGGTAQEGTVLLANAASTAVTNLQDIAEAADEAAEAGERLSEIWDLLFGRTQNVQEASDEFQSSLNDIRDRLTEVAESGGELTSSLEGTSQSAIDNRNMFRDARDNIVDFGVSMLEAGHSAAETEGFLQAARDQLIETAEGFDTGALSAEEYINTLGLTPEAITTIVNTPGLLEAIESGEGLEEILSLLPPEVVTAMQLTGLIPNSIALDNYQVGLDEAGKPVVTVVSTEGIPFATAQVDAYGQVITGDVPNEVITEANFNDIVALSTATAFGAVIRDGELIPAETTTTAVVDTAFGMGAAERYGTDLRDVVPIEMTTDAKYNELIALSTATSFAGHLEEVVPPETETTAVLEDQQAVDDLAAWVGDLGQALPSPTSTAFFEDDQALDDYAGFLRDTANPPPIEVPVTLDFNLGAGGEGEGSDRLASAFQEAGLGAGETTKAFMITVTADTSQADGAIQTIGTGLSEIAARETRALVTVDDAAASIALDGAKTGLAEIDTTTAEASVTLEGAPEVLESSEEIARSLTKTDGTTASPKIELPDADEVNSQIEDLQEAMEELGDTDARPSIVLPTYGVVTVQIVALLLGFARIHAIRATPSIVLPTYSTVVSQITTIQTMLRNLDNASATPRVSLSGYSTVVSQLAVIATMLASLRDKTVTVTTRNVTTGGGRPADRPGMTGMMITQPTRMLVGERGYREALIPLDLPLSRVDPSVRAMAALLRGEGGGPPVAGGIGRQVINNLTITPREADPEAVAAKIINRAAVLALR